MPGKIFRYILIGFVFSLNLAISQIKLPPVNNFNVKDYKGGNQNWSIESANGYIYVANNEGLLEFDGINWYLYKLPNKTLVRSVKVVGDKIYTGSYEEFGYWQRLKNGNLYYTSLSNNLSINETDSQSIWDIYEFENKIIFKSFSTLYILDEGKLNVLKPGYTLMAGTIIDGRFIVQGFGRGLLELKRDELVLLKNTEQISNYTVQAIIPFKDDQLLIGTSLNGFFNYDNNKLEGWKNSFNTLLKENQLNTVTYFKNKLFVGTIKNGVYQYDYDSNTFLNLNVKNGLQNNTVLSSTIDDSNILWLALDNGISAIPTDYYAYYLNPFKEDIGAVYDMIQVGNKAYVATNIGIYKFDDNGVHFIEGSQGHTWSLTLVDEDQIICGHNSGTYEIANDDFSLISPKNGGYIFSRIPENTNQYIQGNYSGITLYTKRSGKWEHKDIHNINFPVKNIVFEKSHTAWISHASKGVFKVTFSENYEQVTKIEDRYNIDFTNIYDIRLFRVEGNIAFFNEGHWFVYNSLEDKIEEFESLNNILKKDKNSIILNSFLDKVIVFKNSDNSIFLRSNLQDEHSQIYLPIKYYSDKLVRGEGEQRATVVNDSLLYIALFNDVLAINTNKVGQTNSIFKPTVSRIYKNHKIQDITGEVELKKRDTLQIELNTPFLSHNSIEYSIGNNHWINSNGKIILTGLPYGSTDLSIRSFINNDEFSDINKIKVSIASPWYMGIWGGLLVFAIISLTVYLITTFNKYILIKHRKYLDEQFNHDQEIHKKEVALENEIKLNELQTRQHEVELNAKTKELANTALEMTKKDELLENIKGELQFFNQEIISKSKFQKLLTTINKNIHTTKDWEVFETNFNEIHDSFFKSLVKTHSKLTPKDLKLCAYLKMSLSTKEIVPIMGISIRGVEIHRYRLRKKLELNNDENINEYLMNIS